MVRLRDLRVFEERKIKIIPARTVNDVTARAAPLVPIVGAVKSSFTARRRYCEAAQPQGPVWVTLNQKFWGTAPGLGGSESGMFSGLVLDWPHNIRYIPTAILSCRCCRKCIGACGPREGNEPSTTSKGNPYWNFVNPLIFHPSVTRLGIHSKAWKWRTLLAGNARVADYQAVFRIIILNQL